MKTLLITIALTLALLPLVSYGVDSLMTDILYETDTFYEDLAQMSNGNGFGISHRVGSTFDRYANRVYNRVDAVQSVARTYIDSWRWGKGIQNDYNMSMYEFIMLPIHALFDFIIPKG